MDPLHLRSAGTSLVISLAAGRPRSSTGAPTLAASSRTSPSSPSRSRTPPSTPPFLPGFSPRPPRAGAAGRGCAGTASPTASPASTSPSAFAPCSAAVTGNSAVVVPGGCRRRHHRGVHARTARRRPAGTAAHRHQLRHLALPAGRIGHRPPGGAGRRRTSGPDRALVPGTAPAAPAHPAGHLGADRPPRPHRPRLLAPVRRRHRRLRQPPRQGLGHAPGLERQPRTVRGHARRRAAP